MAECRGGKKLGPQGEPDVLLTGKLGDRLIFTS